jgi:hypothetical protein
MHHDNKIVHHHHQGAVGGEDRRSFVVKWYCNGTTFFMIAIVRNYILDTSNKNDSTVSISSSNKKTKTIVAALHTEQS